MDRKEPDKSPAESLTVKGELKPIAKLNNKSWALGIITKLAEEDPLSGLPAPDPHTSRPQLGIETPEEGTDAELVARVTGLF